MTEELEEAVEAEALEIVKVVVDNLEEFAAMLNLFFAPLLDQAYPSSFQDFWQLRLTQ